MLISSILEVIQYMTSLGIVHADLKPDNILVTSEPDGSLASIKIIDFGSCFLFDEIQQVDMSTPEYIPPEVLSHLAARRRPTAELLQTMNVWSFDTWSLGCLLLEILTGFPLWLSLKG